MFRPLSLYKASWVQYEKEADIEWLRTIHPHSMFYDKHNNLVFISESKYALQRAIDNNPKAKFLFSIEHNTETHDMGE